jgi:predicted DNA-binding transcriptional regulator AlpA
LLEQRRFQVAHRRAQQRDPVGQAGHPSPPELIATCGEVCGCVDGRLSRKCWRRIVPESDRFLTERETAERFCISRRTLQRWRETGEGPAFVRLSERRLAYSLAELVRWADAHTHKSRAAELAGVFDSPS